MFSWLSNLFPAYASPPQLPGLRRVSRLVLPDNIKWERSPEVQLDCWVQMLNGQELCWEIGSPTYQPTLDEIAESGLATYILPNPEYQCGVYDFSEEYLFVRPGEEVPVWGWHSKNTSRLVQECIGKRRRQSVTLSGTKGDSTFQIIDIFRPQSGNAFRANDYGWNQCRRGDRFFS